MGLSWWSVTDASSESSAFLLFSGPLVSDMLQPPISRSHQPVLSILESYFLYFLFTLLFLIDMGLCYKLLKLRKLASACGSPVRRKQRWWVRASSFVGEPRWPSTGINGHEWPWIAQFGASQKRGQLGGSNCSSMFPEAKPADPSAWLLFAWCLSLTMKMSVKQTQL